MTTVPHTPTESRFPVLYSVQEANGSAIPLALCIHATRIQGYRKDDGRIYSAQTRMRRSANPPRSTRRRACSVSTEGVS